MKNPWEVMRVSICGGNCVVAANGTNSLARCFGDVCFWAHEARQGSRVSWVVKVLDGSTFASFCQGTKTQRLRLPVKME